MKLDVAPMHSDLDQEKREQVMLDFKNNKVRILVATDIVARGIDIEDIGMVINYDVPHDPEDYIHRIGRTARASATGRAVTFVNEEEQGKFHRIEEFIEREIPKLSLPEAVGAGPEYNPAAFSGHGGRRGRSGSGRGGNGRSGDVVGAVDATVRRVPVRYLQKVSSRLRMWSPATEKVVARVIAAAGTGGVVVTEIATVIAIKAATIRRRHSAF